MATTGVVDGTAIILKSGGNTIAYSTNFEFSTTASTRNITSKDTTAGTDYAAQRYDTTLSIEGLIAHDATEGFDELLTDIRALTDIVATWGTFVAGDPEYSANILCTSVTMSAPLDDNATYSAEFVVNGDTTIGTTT